MTIIKRVKCALTALLCAGLLVGCSAGETSSGSSGSQSNSSESSGSVSDNVSDSSSASEDENSNTSSDSSPDEQDNNSASENIRITALKGPTAMGMTKLMDDTETNGYPYEFTISAAVDEISPMVIQGNADIVCVPANLASVLYNKTEGGVQVLAVNTLGVLYICENGNTVTSVNDLKGKTIYASGKGATPEFALNYILEQNGINTESDVTIEWKSEHAECLNSLLNDENGVALLPQPFVTTAITKKENINVFVDFTEEWDNLNNGSALLTGVVIARTEFIQQNPDGVEEFLGRYKESVDYVNSNVSEAAQLVGKYDIVPAAVAEKAIPECNIVCITGSEMKEKLSGYLGVLFEQLDTSVGGALPSDDFYYGA